MNHNNSNEYYNYNYDWSKVGKWFRHFLNFFGLALEKDWSYCDEKWEAALNHCMFYLFNGSEEIQKNMVELIDLIDDGMIDLWKKDLKEYNEGKIKLTKQYAKQLKIVCELIDKYRKENDV